MKDLPNIFKPKLNKSLNNNKSVYYSSLNDERSSNKKNIKDYVLNNSYHNKVIINTHNKKYQSKIVDRMGNNIILEDDTVLSINDIESIYDI